MRVRPVRHDHAIVDAYGEDMTARCHRAEIKNVWRYKTSVRTNLFIVEPDSCFPVRTFERQDNAAARPALLNKYLALIPRNAEVMAWRLGQERNFDVPLGVVFVIFAQIPEAIVK